MSNEFDSIRGQLADIEKALLARNSDAPTTRQMSEGVENQGTAIQKRVLSMSDQYALREELRKKSTAELSAMFGLQLRRTDTGIPLQAWAGVQRGLDEALYNAEFDGTNIQKALDTGGAAALIRQDLEPILYEIFVRNFPAWDRFTKEPANGLVHTWNQITDYGDAQFMSELGTVTDDKSTYVRKTTNISIIGTRRGVSLKSQFAVQAGGMAYNPEALELQGGMRSIAHKMQKTIFQGNASVTGGTASTEDGAYNVDGFDGLRHILAASGAVNCDPTGGTPDDIRSKIDLAATQVADLGGAVNLVYLRNGEKLTFDLQQDKNVRYLDTRVEVTPGILTNAVNTVFGPLPLVTVPGDSIGSYAPGSAFAAASGCADMYLLDENTITLPFLGSEGPTVLDIPIGISGQLTHLYIMFGMWGLAVKALPFSAKVRMRTS